MRTVGRGLFAALVGVLVLTVVQTAAQAPPAEEPLRLPPVMVTTPPGVTAIEWRRFADLIRTGS